MAGKYLRVSSGKSPVLHTVNPATGRSYCQVENNLYEGGWEYVPDKTLGRHCLNCASLIKEEQLEKATKVVGEADCTKKTDMLLLNWRGMHTAPRDGRRILVRFKASENPGEKYKYTVVRWEQFLWKGHWTVYAAERPAWKYFKWLAGFSEWLVMREGSDGVDLMQWTHLPD